MLSRRVGMQHLENVEDAVQSALMKAFEAWTRGDLFPARHSEGSKRRTKYRSAGDIFPARY
jgi:hypothetical protein